jgi:hypothetical protein
MNRTPYSKADAKGIFQATAPDLAALRGGLRVRHEITDNQHLHNMLEQAG